MMADGWPGSRHQTQFTKAKALGKREKASLPPSLLTRALPLPGGLPFRPTKGKGSHPLAFSVSREEGGTSLFGFN